MLEPGGIMGSMSRLLPVIIATALLFIPTSGNPCDEPTETIKGGAPAVKSPDKLIRLDTEEVYIKLHKDSYTVDAVFHFFNTGEAATRLISFPRRGTRFSHVPSLDFRRFQGWINGKEVEFIAEPDPHIYSKGTWYDHHHRHYEDVVSDAGWFKREVEFPSNSRTTIRVRYSLNIHPYGAQYMYGTGFNWKDSIGKAYFIIEAEDVVKTTDVCGRFSETDKQKHVIRERRISANTVVYEIKDFKPDPLGVFSVFQCR